ncbi:roadblock/LC7 domain-containing protein [Deinococcus oregonensis]|uniref:Roadblock/LC7 domain-containing protein n=1 Tax=Deinococcus oregonensis TaxID=1805970 RepID=A0ABV6AX20_9DEIO
MEAPRKVMDSENVKGSRPDLTTPDSAPVLHPCPPLSAAPNARHSVPVLLLSSHVSNRKSLEQMLEGLGLSVQVVTTLWAARTALQAVPHAAALIELPVPELYLLGDLLDGLHPEHVPPVLTLSAAFLEGTHSLAHPPTPDLLREALAPLLPYASLAAVPGQAERLLLTDLMAKPGVLGVTLLNSSGQSVAQQGESLPPHLGIHLVGALETARSFGSLLHGGEMHTAQLEYEHRTLLLAAHGPHVVACILRDSSTSSLIRYLLRTRLAA